MKTADWRVKAGGKLKVHGEAFSDASARLVRTGGCKHESECLGAYNCLTLIGLAPLRQGGRNQLNFNTFCGWGDLDSRP
jgi:hypothetical protein